MSFNVTKDKVLALAGVCQAASLVVQIAEDPSIDQAALVASARSVLNIEADDTLAVFGGAGDLQLGLNNLRMLLGGQSNSRAKTQMGYMMAMDQLATRLSRANNTQGIIGQQLQEINIMHSRALQSDDEGEYDSDELRDLYAELGSLYQKTLSQLPPRIMVNGAKGKLSNEDNVARLRTALFAGVRAAYLWQQLGGRRWHVMLLRKGYVQGIEALRS